MELLKDVVARWQTNAECNDCGYDHDVDDECQHGDYCDCNDCIYCDCCSNSLNDCRCDHASGDYCDN